MKLFALLFIVKIHSRPLARNHSAGNIVNTQNIVNKNQTNNDYISEIGFATGNGDSNAQVANTLIVGSNQSNKGKVKAKNSQGSTGQNGIPPGKNQSNDTNQTSNGNSGKSNQSQGPNPSNTPPVTSSIAILEPIKENYMQSMKMLTFVFAGAILVFLGVAHYYIKNESKTKMTNQNIL